MDTILNQVLLVVAGLVGTGLAILAAWVMFKGKNWLVAKLGQTVYDRAIQVAKGIYILLEDEIAEVKKTGMEKKAEMEAMLLKQFPSLTQTELDAINKTVWESFNHKYSEYYAELVTGTEDTEEDLCEQLTIE